MTTPAVKKSKALKNAWFIRWKIAAWYWDIPQVKHIYPNWEQVEYAITFLRSYWNNPILEAKIAVLAPIRVIKVKVFGAISKRILHRITR